MPRLTIKCDDQVVKECIVRTMATIGRHADNTIVLDDPAASGHHACLCREGTDDVVKDLESTNGTFVNDKRVSQRRLRNGDVVTIGKHQLVFERTGGNAPAVGEPAPDALMSNPSDTVFLDAHKHQALLALLREADAEMMASYGGSTQPSRVGVLRVLKGDSADAEYTLAAETSIIGRSDAALLRLRGWFTPKVAIAIARGNGGYVATAMGGRTLINSQLLKGRRTLQHGDVLEVRGLTVQFSLND